MSPDSMGNTLPPGASTPSRKDRTTAGPICSDTPLKHNTHTVEAGHDDVDGLRAFLAQELDSMPWHSGGRKFLDYTFQNVATTETIEEFLTQSKTYDTQKGRWLGLPLNADNEKELYSPLLNLLKEVLSFSSFNLKNRKVVSCHRTSITHHDDGETVLTTSPDFVILGHSGGAFKQQEFPSSPTYAQCVSPIEAKTNKNHDGFRAHIIQAATYARQVRVPFIFTVAYSTYTRQCFIEQHNRLKVYSALVTESTVILLQFDRGGMMYSEKCNYHKSPETFIRIVLGLASDDEQVGFDTSIYWENGKRWLRTLDALGRVVLYHIVGDGPVFFRRTICGRGTHCWVVSDPLTRQEYFIKESWRSEERESEIELLELVKALPGVGQMIAHEEDGRKTIAYIRGLGKEGRELMNRIWCRVTLERYGGSLDEFSDGLQLLEAYRDIVAGEIGLWEVGVVHRDITIDNMRLGVENAAVGWRGILIDLDMAIRISRQKSLVDTNSRTGSRAFQSIHVLRSYTDGKKAKPKGRRGSKKARKMNKPEPNPYPHDFRDDMESLFYALCWVCWRRGEDGELLDLLPDCFLDWDSANAEAAARSKGDFLNSPMPELPPCFHRGSAFKFLLEGLQELFRGIVFEKTRGRQPDLENGTLEATYPNAKSQMKVFLQLVDDAIAKWKSPQDNVQGPVSIVASASDRAMAQNSSGAGPSAQNSNHDLGDETSVPPSDEEDEELGDNVLATRFSGAHKRSRSWSEDSNSDGEDVLLGHSAPVDQRPIPGLFLARDPLSQNDDDNDSPRSKAPKGKRLRTM
ncbi:hypothetical protein BDN72DRAFT_904372 [Pluteus cervinus]|uniref:Uncharacterized protein n=1 Tax=Pluteus cervinus TaxID=181527 RepID=A0ACD3A6A3_9AGAR|nr:hypothetical protein BDN72DRAFT_904372 [Pluteus cervinus]